MNHQPDPLTRAAILKLKGDELSAAVVIALGGEWRTNKTGDRTLFFNGAIVGWPESAGFVWWLSGYRYAESWSAAGELFAEMNKPNQQQVVSVRGMYSGPIIVAVSDGFGREIVRVEGATVPEALSRAYLLLTLNPQA
jgi:hypothetical protein